MKRKNDSYPFYCCHIAVDQLLDDSKIVDFILIHGLGPNRIVYRKLPNASIILDRISHQLDEIEEFRDKLTTNTTINKIINDVNPNGDLRDFFETIDKNTERLRNKVKQVKQNYDKNYGIQKKD